MKNTFDLMQNGITINNNNKYSIHKLLKYFALYI